VLFPLLEAVAPDVAEALEDPVVELDPLELDPLELSVAEALPVELAVDAEEVTAAVLTAVVLTTTVEAGEETTEVDAEPVPLEISLAEVSEEFTLVVQKPAPVLAEGSKAPT